ncbi:type III secretion system inner rod subunit SctI [Orrella sp. JC864]|uniref:type III secretion system inner rod subunit SctI n=1 Tax=Orrella sp. JC864 TaxID=3120298 RepID=UPI0012BB4F3F
MEIATLAASLAPLPALPAGPALAPAEPSSLATERFNALMAAADAPAPSPVHAALSAAFAPAAQAAPTLGSQILAGLQGTASEFSQRWQGISSTLERVAVSPNVAEMLRAQAEMLQVSVQYELVGKAVSRTTQNIDTLVRMS